MADDNLNAVLASMDGQSAGGCAHCNADMELKNHGTGVWVLHVQHDSWCPVLRAHRGARHA